MILRLNGLVVMDQSFSKQIQSFLLSKLKMLLYDLAMKVENTLYKSLHNTKMLKKANSLCDNQINLQKCFVMLKKNKNKKCQKTSLVVQGFRLRTSLQRARV